MKTLDYLKNYSLYFFLAAGTVFTGCDDDEAPQPENELEVITDVALIFTNTQDATDVVEAHAEDPDGEGIQELQILDEITLDQGKTYALTFDIENALAEEEDEDHDEEEEDEDEHGHAHGADITAEIEEEDHEHQFFFSFTNDAFVNPTGNGNVDNASDAVNYNDTDDNGNPVGLSTSWTTSATPLSGGTFTVRLQHQPDVKTSTSGANDGDTDFELQFVLNIQ